MEGAKGVSRSKYNAWINGGVPSPWVIEPDTLLPSLLGNCAAPFLSSLPFAALTHVRVCLCSEMRYSFRGPLSVNMVSMSALELL